MRTLESIACDVVRHKGGWFSQEGKTFKFSSVESAVEYNYRMLVVGYKTLASPSQGTVEVCNKEQLR